MNYHSKILIVVACCFAVFTCHLQAQFASINPPLWGYVVSQSQSGRPVSGVTVSLWHPILGRSVPVVTNLRGYYSFVNLPPRVEPYTIEVFWGRALIFRGTVYYSGGSVHYPIRVR
jgi:hypothetical protein